jgi:hypothetical protein
MATKQDLLSEITNQGYEIVEETDNGQLGKFQFWIETAMDTNTTAAKKREFQIVENTDTGNAYWRGTNPFSTSEPSFEQELENWLASVIGVESSGETLEQATPVRDKVSTKQERAVVNTVWDNGTNYVEKQFLVWKNTEGNFEFKEIT